MCLCVSNHNYFSCFYIVVANAVILVFLDFSYDLIKCHCSFDDQAVKIWSFLLGQAQAKIVDQLLAKIHVCNFYSCIILLSIQYAESTSSFHFSLIEITSEELLIYLTRLLKASSRFLMDVIQQI